MGKAALQVAEEPCAVPFEEVLVGAEDGGEDVGGDFAQAQLFEVVEPKVVFGKEDHGGAEEVDKAGGVGGGVHGEVADKVGLRVVFAHFVAGGGEEGDADFKVGVLYTEGLENGAGLFEFAKGGGMEPGGLFFAHGGYRESPEGVFPALCHLTGLAVEEGGDMDAQGVEENA